MPLGRHKEFSTIKQIPAEVSGAHKSESSPASLELVSGSWASKNFRWSIFSLMKLCNANVFDTC